MLPLFSFHQRAQRRESRSARNGAFFQISKAHDGGDLKPTAYSKYNHFKATIAFSSLLVEKQSKNVLCDYAIRTKGIYLEYWAVHKFYPA
jgi:hypothetical protein